MSITFVVHGKLRYFHALKKSILTVFRDEFQLGFIRTDPVSGAKDAVRKAIEAGTAYVIIVGGDGSVNEAINGYMMIPEAMRVATVLGVLPMGSGNDFARSLQVSKDLKGLYTLIHNRSIMKVDVCKMKYQGLGHETEYRYFINISDIGLGGLAAVHVRNSPKILGPNLSYAKAIISSLLTYKKQPISLKSPEFKWEGEIMSLCMANGKYFGSGMCIAPEACLNDGLIQLIILGNIRLSDYLKNLPKIKRGEKIKHKEVSYTAVSSLSIESKGAECPIDMDGEFIGHTPIEVEVLPEVVKMLTPVV